MNSLRRTALVALAAVLGIVVAAAVTWSTSQLVRQHIGLASEPLSAGRRLLPPAARGAAPAGVNRTHPSLTTSTRTTTTPGSTSTTRTHEDSLPATSPPAPASGRSSTGVNGEHSDAGSAGGRDD